MKRINSNNSGRGIIKALTLATALTAAGPALAVPPSDGGGGGMSVNVFGLQHTGTAGVTFAQTFDGTLLVGGLNAPGAELIIDLTQAANFEFDSTVPIMPAGSTLTLEKRGSIDGGPVQVLSRMVISVTPEGSQIVPNFAALGANLYQAEVWDGDALQGIVRHLDASSPILQYGPPSISANRPGEQCKRLLKSCRPDACAKWSIVQPDSDFDLNGVILHGDSIVIEPETPEGVGVCPNVSYTSQFALRGTGIPGIELHSEALHVGGIAYRALGGTPISASGAQVLEACCIGGTGQDGVMIDLERGWSGSSRATVDLSPIVLNPVGSEFTVTGVGWATAPEPVQTGTVRCTAEATGTRVSADFSALGGGSLKRLEVRRDGIIQNSYEIATLNAALVQQLPGGQLPQISGCGFTSPETATGAENVYWIMWSSDCRIVVGPQTVVGNEIRIRPAHPVVHVREIASLSLAGRNLAGIEVLNVDVPRPIAGDLNCDGTTTVGDIGSFVLALTNPAGYAAQFPGCPIGNADLNGDGTVSVGDIGSFVQLLTGG